jgi:hypothetical protein
MIATTRGSLLRGVASQDALGDLIDDDSAVVTINDRTDFPISIIERSRREFDEASNAWRTVRYFSARVSSIVPAKAGDRIRDNRDQSIFIVSEVESMPRGLSGRSSVTLTMKRTSP